MIANATGIITNNVTEGFVFNFERKDQVLNPIVQKGLEIIKAQVNAGILKNNYNFCVLKRGVHHLLNFEVYAEKAVKIIAIKNAQLLSFEEVQKELPGAPSNESDFISFLNNLPQIQASDEAKSVDEEILAAVTCHIEAKSSKGKINKIHNFCVVKEGIHYLLRVSALHKASTDKVTITSSQLLSYQEALQVFPGVSDSEEDFIEFLKWLPLLEPKYHKDGDLSLAKSVSTDTEKAFVLPELYQPAAPFSWLKDFQSHLDQAHNIQWVYTLNSRDDGKKLPDPTQALAITFNEDLPVYNIKGEPQTDTTLRKIVGWIIFTQKTLEQNNYAITMQRVQEYQLGKILTQCANLLRMVPDIIIDDELLLNLAGQIISMSASILRAVSHAYFFKTEEWKKGMNALQSTRVDMTPHSNLKEIVETIYANTEGAKSTYVTAWDTVNERLLVANSGRRWALEPQKLIKFKEIKDKCQSLFPEQEVALSARYISIGTVQFLISTVHSLFEFCIAEKDTIYIGAISNLKIIRDSFIKQLMHLLKWQLNPSKRELYLCKMYRLFPKALAECQWQQLVTLFRKEQPLQEEIIAIVEGNELTQEQAINMIVYNWNCGEAEIALNSCRDLPKLLAQNPVDLPGTLGERLFFSAFLPTEKINLEEFVGQQELIQIDPCKKCQQLWPIYEALYWSIRQSGLDMHLLEQLDKRIQNNYYRKLKGKDLPQ
ncbi:MAG: hypothetical protein K0S74_1256 [Chlamydiales bacterium]|jgi:hypothetical protein|nr:hypothetical protein [Chlamydiales bacterium]